MGRQILNGHRKVLSDPIACRDQIFVWNYTWHVIRGTSSLEQMWDKGNISRASETSGEGQRGKYDKATSWKIRDIPVCLYIYTGQINTFLGWVKFREKSIVHRRRYIKGTCNKSFKLHFRNVNVVLLSNYQQDRLV